MTAQHSSTISKLHGSPAKGRKKVAVSSHIIGLDSLKAFAIIGITLFHMFPQIVSGGYLGVNLFFLITGYLLAYTTLQNWQRGNYSIRSYFKKRLLRIYPPLILVLLTTIGLYSFLLPTTIESIRPEIQSILLGYNNWWQMQQNADYFARIANSSPFTHLWFLGVEIQYFAIWPALFGLYLYCKRKLSSNVGIIAISLIALLSAAITPYIYTPTIDITRVYYGTDTRLYALLFGAVLGLYRGKRRYYNTVSSFTKFIKIVLFIALTVIAIMSYWHLHGQLPIVYQGGMLLMTIGFCLMLTLTANNALPIGRWIDIPPLRWIGKQSYGIFLWQYPVLFLFQYMGWQEHLQNPMLYHTLIIIAILLLTLWTDELMKAFEKKPSLKAILTSIRQSYVATITIIAFILMGYGVNTVVHSSNEKATEISELQNRLDNNATMLQAENKKIAERRLQQESAVKAAVNESLQGVAFIGDSVMLGSAGALRQHFPDAYIDAKVSRYVKDGLPIAKEMNQQGLLGNVVLIGLGTNGPITGYYEKETDNLVEYLGSDREIFWVNIYGPHLEWETANNTYLEKLAAEHENITIIDWHTLASTHPKFLTADHVHPTVEGIKEYAKLVHDTMEKKLSEKIKQKLSQQND